MSKKIAIIGAGLSGLSAAIHGINQGFEVDIFEKNSFLGGRVSHSEIDGFIVDHGFQVINPGYPEIKELNAFEGVASSPIFSRLDFIDNEGVESFISPRSFASLISHKSGSIFQKFDFLTFLTFRTSGLVTMGDQRVRFKRLYDTILEPFLTGVFLNNPVQVRSTTAQKICRSFLRGKPQVISGGVGNFVERLANRVPSESIHLNSAIREIKKDSHNNFSLLIDIDGKNFEYPKVFDYVIVASASRPGEITGTSAGNSREWLASTTVYMSCAQIAKMDNALFLGKKEFHQFVNTIAISQVDKSLAPSDQVLIATTYLGEMTAQMLQKNDGELINEVAIVYGVNASDLHLLSIQYIQHSLPSFERVDPIDPDSGELENRDRKTAGIFYAGDYLIAPSQNGALESGRKAIQTIKDFARSA